MLVVDASLLVAAFFEEEHTVFARRVVSDHLAADILAPSLLPWEFANVVWKKRRRSEVQAGQALEGGAFLDSLRVTYSPELIGGQASALAELALATGLTAYDAAYLSLAMEVSAPLATLDRDLTKAALQAGLVVHSPFA